jgi:GT2 family glycosyltransferase
MIAVIVLTHEREHLLRLCVERVLARTSDQTTEIVIWNNGSSDGTRELLDAIIDPRVRVVHHPENIGMNAYHEAVALTKAPYVIDLDDDMIEAPPEWDRTLLDAFQRLPDIGFLAANLADNPHDVAARVMYDERPHEYSIEIIDGLRLKRGPVGGGCALTSRELLQRAGGFRQRKGEVFWLEDAAFIKDLERFGLGAAYLDDLQLTHAGGDYYSKLNAAKHEYWHAYWMKEVRKNRVKRALLRVPMVARLNARHQWFRISETPEM